MAKITDKRWDKAFEKDIYTAWKTDGRYAFDSKSTKPVFSIDTPPPYVNTPVHAGQVTTYILMDMFARFKRMTGHNVLFPLGLDKNGLPIEMAAEKKYNVKLTDIPREKALEYCRKLLEESSLASVESFMRAGIGFNSWKIGTGVGEVYETDSEDYRTMTQGTFIDLWKKGLIYEDDRVNNYCPGCQTTLADAEVVYEERSGFFNDITFTIKETGEKVIVGTTRPELLATCSMVIFNPKDERYQHLEGKTAVTPIYNKEIPIKSHPSAEMDKGTGLVMMCSFGDLTDIRFFREQGLQPIISINKDGTMNEQAGFLKGLPVKEARKKIVEELNSKGLLVKRTPTQQRSPICERSNDPIEFINMPELYLKQVEFKDDMKRIAREVQFFDPKSRQILLDWIDSVSIDWPITRRRFYATEVPLWYCTKCNEIILPEKGTYYQPWKEEPPIKNCPKCKGTEFKGDIRVFDTWFDSSNTPLYILQYDKDAAFFKKHLPCSLRPQGKEIVRTWLYYTLLKCYHLTGKTIFKDAWINYHIVDENGIKMSKSKGNVIDPKDILDRYGAEPYRLWAVIEGNLERTDFKCSFGRIEGAGKTLTKLWNVARFVSLFDESTKPKQLQPLDEWIIAELNRLITFARERFDKYDVHNPTVELKNFLWETFASHYLELVKNRAYNSEKKFSQEEQQSALYTLHYCLNILLKLLAPVIPLLTYKLYDIMHNKDIHAEPYPEVEHKVKGAFSKQDLMELNSAVWKTKKDNGKSLRDSIAELVVNDKFKPVEKDLMLAHHVQKLSYGKFKIML